MLRWNGVTYLPGVVIPEELYEEYIDRAYGRGMNLRDTMIWNDRYIRGFALPDDNCGWLAFAYDGKLYTYLGCFDKEQLDPDTPEEDKEYELILKANASPPEVSIPILRDLYLCSGEKISSVESAISHDDDCINWFIDYWNFVKWYERGNECMISEVGFEGFIETILDPEDVSSYLKDADCNNAIELDKRLSKLHKRYSGKGKRR